MRRVLSAMLVMILLAGCQDRGRDPDGNQPALRNKFHDEQIRNIYELADRRSSDSLISYLQHKDERYQEEAALALGSVQDDKALPELVRMLTHKDERLVSAAAFAIGQIGDSASAGALLDVMQSNLSGETLLNLGAALGKCATEGSMRRMLDLWADKTLPYASLAAVCQALYRAGLKGVVPEGGRALAYQALSTGDPTASFFAAAYLGRVAKLGEETDPELLISTISQLGSADIRQHLVKALKRCSHPSCSKKILQIVSDDNEDDIVRVNAIRAAGGVHDIDRVALSLAGSDKSQIGVAAAEYLREHSRMPADSMLRVARSLQFWRPRTILLSAAIRNARFYGNPRATTLALVVVDSLLQDAGAYEKGNLLSARAEASWNDPVLIQAALKNERIVSVYATEAIFSQFMQTASADSRSCIKFLGQALETGDPGIIALCAEFLAEASPAVREMAAGAVSLESAKQKLKLPQDIETINALEKAIAKQKGIPVQLSKVGFQNPIDWNLVLKIPRRTPAVIETTKGEIVMRLKVNEAPGTVANFVKLVNSGFYNGKTFHRMVPAFVAQGGCPRGDGWGSTPETIRSEWAPITYTQGMVGMASAGKDTESCQWFVVHCSTPHLDGRYTIFAEVVSGMEVVQVLEVGDSIRQITLPDLRL